jgi:hypothetical protein
MICTAGQTIKLAFNVGTYISRNLCETVRRPPPSAIVITVKNNAIPASLVHEFDLVISILTYQLVQRQADQMQPSSLLVPVRSSSMQGKLLSRIGTISIV